MWTYLLVIEAEEAEAEITQGERPEGAELGTAPTNRIHWTTVETRAALKPAVAFQQRPAPTALGDPMRYVLVCRDTEKTTLPRPPTPLPLLLQVRLRVPGP